MSPAMLAAEYEVPHMLAMIELLKDALIYAQSIKPDSTIEPPLTKSHFEAFITRLHTIFPSAAPDYVSQGRDTEKGRLYVVVETAARKIFSSMVAATSIDSPEFVRVWNLFDFLSVLSDNEQCDPALLFWLVEELLDSQTVNGCRKVFDFLESRRERITAKNLKQKSLVILRSCNDLLRRLSRAEDAAFCGRVYIFMFQSIPPGDRSSVNLRGEYHVENITDFEEIPTASDGLAAEKMDVDTEDDSSKNLGKDVKVTTKAVSFGAKNMSEEKSLDTDALYPVFWSLQHFFSQPTTLFDTAELARFKNGIEITMKAFETVEKIQKSAKGPEDNKIIPQKRKGGSNEDLRSTNNNPKYLTSRELFELEISDLYFRRHILIQAFIIIDFLLSLTPQARAKIAKVQQQNRSVVYADKNLGEEDAKWARGMKERITSYIQADSDGFFFFRVVESVISRDKGWVRWKIENCPPIERPSVSPTEFNEAKANAKRLAMSRRPKTGLNSLSLAFMAEKDSIESLETLKDPAKWKLPDLAEFKDKIANDDLDLDFAKSEKEKTQILESKASKTWRALRVARRSNLSSYDKVEDWRNVDAIFQELDAEEMQAEEVDDAPKGRRPNNKKPIILTGPTGAGKSTLTSLLLDKQKGVFDRIIQHTTRAPRDGEVNGQHFHFVDSKTFDTMRDGDYLIEFRSSDDGDYGTSKKLVDALETSNKVALIQLDREAIQMAKDYGFPARVVFIAPPNLEELEARLQKTETLSEEEIQRQLKAAREEIDQSSSNELYDKVITNDDLEAAYTALEEFIYGTSKANNIHEDPTSNGDTTMKD